MIRSAGMTVLIAVSKPRDGVKPPPASVSVMNGLGSQRLDTVYEVAA